MKTYLVLVLLTLFSSAGALQSTEKIRLDLANTIITENGKTVIEIGGKCAGGQVVAFHLPQKGWYVASVEPFEGYDFQKIGKLDGNKISFQYDNRSYEIVSDQPLSKQAQTLDLWVVRIGPPADKTADKRISCATDFKYWLETTVLKDEKK